MKNDSWYKELRQETSGNHFWSRGTKINVGIALVVVCILLGTSFGYAVTRTITDTGDTVDTFIRNSKGNYWTINFANLQLAIYDLNSTNGGRVDVPNCNITFTTTLKGTNNLQLQGMGKNSTIFFLNAGVNKDMINFSNCHNCLVEGIRFNFNNWSQSDTGNLSIIRMSNFCSFITIQQCSFWNGHGSMIETGDFMHPANNITIQDCDFHNRRQRFWGGAISFWGSDCIASNNFIEDMWAVAMRVHGSVYYTPYPERCIIDGNIITGSCGHGIHMEYARNCTITNNIIYNLNSTAYNGYDAATAYSSGIIIGTTSLYVTVSNNYINGVKRWGISVQGPGGIVTGNTVLNYVDYGIQTYSHCSVSGNYIKAKNGVSPSVGITALNNCTITGNRIYAQSTTYYNQMGISVSGHCIITGNYLNNTYAGIRVDTPGKNILINDNEIINCANTAIMLNDVSFCSVSNNIINRSSLGIRIYKSHNNTITGNILQTTSAAASSSIYEDTAPANYNKIENNNIRKCKVNTIVLIGINSYEMLVNTTTGLIGIHTGSGTIWK